MSSLNEAVEWSVKIILSQRGHRLLICGILRRTCFCHVSHLTKREKASVNYSHVQICKHMHWFKGNQVKRSPSRCQLARWMHEMTKSGSPFHDLATRAAGASLFNFENRTWSLLLRTLCLLIWKYDKLQRSRRIEFGNLILAGHAYTPSYSDMSNTRADVYQSFKSSVNERLRIFFLLVIYFA